MVSAAGGAKTFRDIPRHFATFRRAAQKSDFHPRMKSCRFFLKPFSAPRVRLGRERKRGFSKGNSVREFGIERAC
jgi:hypothetical protein